MGALVVGCPWKMILPPTKMTKCELQTVAAVPEAPKIVVKVDETKLWWHKVKHALRLIRRIIKLMIALSPVAALYPLQYLLTTQKPDEEDAHEVALAALAEAERPDGPIGWYYRLCLQSVEWSGAAAIKIMQWAGSRPDMFGQAFCSIFSKLQDDTTPHSWKHTEQALREAFGDDWREHIRLGEILGSGCIAQVYKGVVLDKDGKEQEVAVKGT
jgi:predicted unusual protein kinase regulating ubiquinone biosynthesis (AarF/ABC1/UbiB family)